MPLARFKTVAIFIVALALHLTPPQAQTASPQKERLALAERVFDDVMYKVSNASTRSERSRLSAVTVEVVDDFRDNGDFNGAYALKSYGGNKIIVTETFIYALQRHAVAQQVGILLGVPGYSEYALTELVNAYEYRGRQFVADAILQSLSPKQRETVNRAGYEMWVLSLAQVLLHELGHYATEGFYTSSTPRSEIRRIERESDKWAVSMANRCGLSYLGVIGTMTYLHNLYLLGDYLRPTHQQRKSTHDSPADRTNYGVLETLGQLRKAVVDGVMSGQALDQLVGEVRKFVDTEISDRNRPKEFYFHRAENLMATIDRTGLEELRPYVGMDYYRLAHLEKEAGNDKDYTLFMILGAKMGYAPAQVHAGYALEHGIGFDRNPSRALYWYEQAANQGYLRAERLIEMFDD
jgi:hypothetical protein